MRAGTHSMTTLWGMGLFLALAASARAGTSVSEPFSNDTSDSLQESNHPSGLKDFDIRPARFELSIALGTAIIRTPHLSDLGSAGLSVALEMSYFFNANSGVSLLFGMDSYSMSSTVFNGIPSNSNSLNPSLSGLFLAVDYTYRAHLSERFKLDYSVGPGLYYWDLTGIDPSSLVCDYSYGCGYGSQDLGGATRFMVSQQLSLTYRFASNVEDFSRKSGVGIGLYDFWIPSGSWGALPVSGNGVDGVLFFIMGW